MQKKIRCIALDLDRTTLKTDGTLSERTKKALKLAVNEGVCVVIVSGRAFHTIPKEILSIGWN